MRGAKGGFWNLLLERFRKRLLKRKIIKNEEQKLNDKKALKEITDKKKKEKEIIINYYIKENKNKYKLEKIPKKGKIKPLKLVEKENKKIDIEVKKIKVSNIIDNNTNKNINIHKIKKVGIAPNEKQTETIKVDSNEKGAETIKVDNNKKQTNNINKNKIDINNQLKPETISVPTIDLENNIFKNSNIKNKNQVGIDKLEIKKSNNNKNLNIEKTKNKEDLLSYNNPKQEIVKNNNNIKSNVESSNNDVKAILIKEITSIIGKDREKLQKLNFKSEELNNRLDNAKTIDEINKIEKEIQEVIKQINEIINNYNSLSNGNYKKLNNEKINSVLSKAPNTNILIDVKSKIKNELNYYNKIIDTKKNIYNTQDKKENKKHKINNKNQLFSYENSELTSISDINKQLNIKLKEQQEIYKEFNDLIANIKADKIVSTKYSFVDRILNGTANIMTGTFSLKLMKQKNIPFFALGLFMLGNSLRNMRKVVKREETIKYIPSDDYSSEIESNMSNFYLIDYMLNDSLYQVSRLKYEYIDEFKNYHGLESYEKNLNKIINIEKQIINKQKQVSDIKNKMYDTLDKNNQKIKIIKDMNK